MIKLAPIIIILLSLLTTQPVKAQTKVWLFDGSIIAADSILLLDSIYSIKSPKGQLYVYAKDIYAITTPEDTTIVNDSLLPRKYALDFLQGYHDGLKKLNIEAFLPSIYVSIFDNFLFVRYTCVVRNLPSFLAFAGSAMRRPKIPSWNSPEEAYRAGYKLGQIQRSPADIALGTAIGCYMSITVFYFLFEK